ncbi:MAG: hypothetical protein GVY13_06055 [Alphaproteobacteria bacterium]|jgi:hypothetical protein|nr:hypothetical protein [Alphaproteobacteria bacterium]
MLAAAFLGLAYCALPTLLFGLIRPYAVSMGVWPTTRGGVVGLAAIQWLVGMVGFAAVYEAAKYGQEVTTHNIALIIAIVSGMSAAYRLRKGPRSEREREANRSGNPKWRTADRHGTAASPGPARGSADAAGPAPDGPAPSPLDGLAPEAGADLRTAMDNVAKLRRWIGVFEGHALHGILHRIAENADTTIQEVIRDPGDFARVRRALVHYLSHVVAVLDHLATVHIATGQEELLDRAAATLDRLIPVFEGFRDRAFEDDALQLDARLELLDREILAHGPQPGRAAAGG